MASRPTYLTQASFTGMRDSLDPTTADPRKAQLLQNVYPTDTFMGAAVVGRPGLRQVGSQLGQTGARRVQGLYQFTKLDGTEYTVAFCGGKMYTLTWASEAWAEVTLSGVSLSTVEPVYCVTFTDKLVVSDGVNRPWTWDGTTFVDLTNCPVLYGPPVVYYAKLFGVKTSERNTLVWSEEADATIGYEAGGYNNAWTLGQTDQEAIEALDAGNDALTYFRSRTTGAVSGAVTPEFQTTGTHEGVSLTVGTMSPRAVVQHEGSTYFLSADGYPYVLRGGAEPKALWADLRETLAVAPKGLTHLAVGANYTPSQHVLLGICGLNQSEVGTLIAIDTRTDEIAGLWTGFNVAALAMVKNLASTPTLFHGSENGYVYLHGNPDENLWNDQLNTTDGGTTAILHRVTGTPMGYAVAAEKMFDRFDLNLRVLGTFTGTVTYKTPRGTSTGQSVAASVTADGTWNGTWDGSWFAGVVERHAALGWSGRGRWVQPTLSHQSGSEQFGLTSWQVTAFRDGDFPGAY